MANPQLEDGYTPISNDVLSALARIRIPGEATQVLFVILRKTWGFKKKVDRIALSQFCAATGLLQPNVSRAISRLLSMNIIKKNPSTSSSINSDCINSDCINIDTGYITSYCFNKDFETWKPVPKLIQGCINFDIEPISKLIHTKEIFTKERKRIVGFEELWKDYPKKDGRKEAERHFNASVKCEQDLRDIRQALGNYKRHLAIETWKPAKNGSTWFNNWRDWVDWKEGQSGTNREGELGRYRSQTSADRAAEVLMAIGQGGGDEGGGDKDVSGL